MSESTWERHSHAVWSATERVWSRESAAYIRWLCDRGLPIGISADGSWNKRREAPKHCLCLNHQKRPFWIHTPEKDVRGEKDEEECIVLEGNYEGSSKGMEAAAWAEAADELDAIDPRFRWLVTAVCVDRDASVTDTIKVQFDTHLPIELC